MQHVDTEGMAGWIPGGSPSRQIVAAAGIQEEVEHLRTQVITDYCTVLYTGNPVYRYNGLSVWMYRYHLLHQNGCHSTHLQVAELSQRLEEAHCGDANGIRCVKGMGGRIL